jgi:integrase
MLFRVYARYVPNLTRKDGSAMEKLLNSSVEVSHDPLPVSKYLEDVDVDSLGQDDDFWQQFVDSEGDEFGGVA